MSLLLKESLNGDPIIKIVVELLKVKMVLIPKLIFVFFFNATLDLSDKFLNKIQGILIKFIWSNKKLRVRSKIIAKRLEKGGLAVANRGENYQAAILAACFNWWRFPSDNVSLLMEQDVFEWSLTNWLVLDKRMGIKLRGVNKTAELLGKVWM